MDDKQQFLDAANQLWASVKPVQFKDNSIEKIKELNRWQKDFAGQEIKIKEMLKDLISHKGLSQAEVNELNEKLQIIATEHYRVK